MINNMDNTLTSGWKIPAMKISFLFITFLTLSCSRTEEISQWRGPDRDGIYPEQNLLKTWPENGPDLLWVYEGLGAGHGSVSIGKEKIFILGMPDTTGFLYALGLDGKLLWKKEYGEEWHRNYTGPRSTPTLVGEMIYFLSGQGVVYCFNVNTGEKIWSVDILKEFDAENIIFGITESLLVEGHQVFCTPGGKEHNIVSLNRFTGETVWTSPGNRQISAYCSPILINHNGSKLFVTVTDGSVIGVDSQTGEFYWEVPQSQRNNIHANTPVYYNGYIYCAGANDKVNSGLLAIRLSPDGKIAETAWRNPSFNNLMGGLIIEDGYIYASKFRTDTWSCIDIHDGEIIYDSSSLTEGVIIRSDELFYCYTTDGEMALIEANPSSFNVISKFKITHGTDQHWAHPVIHEGRLYIRHGDALMAYDLRENRNP